jgi:hypothetical protein
MGSRTSFIAPPARAGFMRHRVVVAQCTLVAATALLAACAGPSGAKPVDTTAASILSTNPQAPPAPSAAGTAAAGTLGKPADLGDGISAVVSTMTLGGDSRGSWLQIKLKVDNRGPAVVTNPQAGIFCAADPRAGGWQAQSTYRRYDQLAPGNSSEGTLNLLLPGDDRGGGTLSLPCSTPAVVRVYRLDGGTTMELPISEEFVGHLVKRSAGVAR